VVEQVIEWAIADKFFIYKPEEGDENSQFIHIVNLGKNNQTFLVEDIFPTKESQSTFTF